MKPKPRRSDATWADDFYLHMRSVMDQECPKCRKISPESALFCDCGYSFLAQQVERHCTPEHNSSDGLGVFATYLFCALIGVGLMIGAYYVYDPASFLRIVWVVMRREGEAGPH